jgi:hypothetical protein
MIECDDKVVARPVDRLGFAAKLSTSLGEASSVVVKIASTRSMAYEQAAGSASCTRAHSQHSEGFRLY